MFLWNPCHEKYVFVKSLLWKHVFMKLFVKNVFPWNPCCEKCVLRQTKKKNSCEILVVKKMFHETIISHIIFVKILFVKNVFLWNSCREKCVWVTNISCWFYKYFTQLQLFHNTFFTETSFFTNKIFTHKIIVWNTFFMWNICF